MKTPIRASDLRGLGRLAIEATTGVTDVVEAMHHNISGFAGRAPSQARARGLSGFVYRSVRGVTRLVGGSLDAVLASVAPLLEEAGSPRGREALLAALNGVLGDHLAATGNPLAIPMRLRRDGRALALERDGSPRRPSGEAARAGPRPVHERSAVARASGHDHGAALARDLGFTPLYLHYNSGPATSPTNGRALAASSSSCCDAMAGAARRARDRRPQHGRPGGAQRLPLRARPRATRWPRAPDELVFLGTPHHGAPLERGGNWVDLLLGVSRYAAPFARLGQAAQRRHHRPAPRQPARRGLGRAATASPARPTAGIPSRCRPAWSATRSPRRGREKRMPRPRRQRPGAARGSEPGPRHPPNPANGRSPAPITSSC